MSFKTEKNILTICKKIQIIVEGMNQSTKRNIPRWLLPVILMVIGLTVGAGLTLALQGNGVLPNHVSGIVSEVSGQLSSGESDAKQTVQELYDAAVKDAVLRIRMRLCR